MKDNGEYMKKIYKILIIIFIFMIQINVHAEDNVQVTSLPKSYSYGGYEFTIEGLALNVYKINENDEEDDGWNNYATNNPDKTIQLNSSDLSISPVMSSSTISGVPLSLVNLNFDITKEKLEEVLENEGITPTTENNYLSEIVVRYKLSKIKIESANMYNLNYFKTLINITNSREWANEVSLNTTIEQTINIIVLSYNEETNRKEVFYETRVTEDNNLGSALLNYLGLSIEGVNSLNDKVNDLLMFYNIENIEDLLDISEVDEDTEDIKDNILHPSTSTTTNNQVVNVQDTLSNKSNILYIISILMITIGISLIGNIILKNKM